MTELDMHWEQPPHKYRPLQIIHFHFPKTESEMASYLDRAEKLKLGGFVVNVDWQDANTYLYDDKEWDRLRQFISLARERGFCIWLYDERVFPSGAAGKWVYEGNPEYHVQGVVCERVDVGSELRGRLTLPEGTLLSVGAYRVDGDRIRLEGMVDLTAGARDGSVEWDLPDGQWAVLAFAVQRLEWITRPGTPYIDLLNPAAVRKFIDVTHENYLKHLGPDIMREIGAIFTDEPALPVHGCYSVFRVSYPVIAWTDGLDKRFEAQFGYDICRHLPQIFYETHEPYRQTRRDFWSLVSRLFEDSYFRQIGDWCEKHGTRFTGHLYGEETLSMQVGLEGDLFGTLRPMQLPGVDRLYCTNPQDLIPEKTASSVAHLFGRTQVMSESSNHFEKTFWKKSVDVNDMIDSCTYQYALGVNTIASYFAMDLVPAEDRAMFQTYMGRLALALYGGEHVAPILVHHPIGGSWERYQAPPSKYWRVGPGPDSLSQPDSMKQLEIQYGETLSHLMDSQWDFDLIDDRGLADCTVRNGHIDTGREQFRALVLFGASRPEDAALQTIRRFVRTGGPVVIVATDDAESIDWLDEFDGKATIVAAVEEVVSELNRLVVKDVVLTRPDPHIWYLHRRHIDRDIYMIYNRDCERKNIEVTLSVVGNVELRDPMTGATSDLGASSPVSVTVPARQAVFLVVTPKA